MSATTFPVVSSHVVSAMRFRVIDLYCLKSATERTQNSPDEKGTT